MTRSPLQSANHRPQGHGRNGQPKASFQDLQRGRLAKQVMQSTGTTSTASPSTGESSTTNNVLAVEVPVVASLTPEQMYSNFEEWIKMCTDNKINAKNSWNFALIDYFHEMTFLRDGDSINFQKASCTLDGCVKIYTSRVDSVATETGKLLSGLADSATSGDPDDDEDPQRSGDAPERRTRRRGNRAESTLLRDFSSIALKKFDLDFAVDPLFKKTSADFDEGGARGLLLNHLALDRDCKIIFDASDASSSEPAPNDKQTDEGDLLAAEKTQDAEQMDEDIEDNEGDGQSKEDKDAAKDDDKEAAAVAVEEEEEKVEDPMDVDANEQSESSEQQEQEPIDQQLPQPAVEKEEEEEEEEKDSMVEISRLRAKLPPVEIIATLQICPTLQGYNFFSETDFTMPDLEDTADQIENPVDLAPPTTAGETGDDYANDDYDGMDDYDFGDDGPMLDGIDDVPFGDGHGDADGDAAGGQDEGSIGGDNENPLQETDFMSAMTGGNGSDMFSYFDTAFNKNWAGPEHWKLRRPVSKVAKEKDTTANQEEGAEGEKSRKKQKQAFQIDFIAGEDVDEDMLFATDKRTKISMSSVQESAVKDDIHLLPDDMHFSSKQLLKLFLKPTFSMRSKKKQRQETGEEDAAAVPQEDDQQYDYDPGVDDYGPDTQFWADQQTESTPDEPYQTQADTQDQTVLTALEDTSFYQDSYYDTYDDVENSHLYGDALITNHRLKKTKPLYVNYARTAKRVDVKKLKDNLWKALTLPKPDTPSPPVESTPGNDSVDPDSVQGVQRFTDILQELRRMYTVKALKDISVPFCFICLLHLANERNLTISRPTNLADPDYDPDDFVLGEAPMDETFLNEVTIVQNV
ncbi:condensin complex subunit 2/barren [Zychaea mexicana]|uniref:condensin complex subunit 2/barren n=1 Tax=Zychaea mexicana TaxID=64656 RepID=UPI0022FDE725|nr:condensin complex subunit 2/barren [Zychaea mexicana]KAI9498442.1 condensin complex subunit 2/barren [Zychaea mexicana]